MPTLVVGSPSVEDDALPSAAVLAAGLVCALGLAKDAHRRRAALGLAAREHAPQRVQQRRQLRQRLHHRDGAHVRLLREVAALAAQREDERVERRERRVRRAALGVDGGDHGIDGGDETLWDDGKLAALAAP